LDAIFEYEALNLGVCQKEKRGRSTIPRFKAAQISMAKNILLPEYESEIITVEQVYRVKERKE